MTPRRATEKLATIAAAGEKLDRWRTAGERVAVVSEAFDLLDRQTVRRLGEARSGSGRVIAAVWSDARAEAALGSGRPLLAAPDRALLVAALRSVDLVVVLDDPFPDWLRAAPGVEVHLREGGAAGSDSPPPGDAAEMGGREASDPVHRLRERLTRS